MKFFTTSVQVDVDPLDILGDISVSDLIQYLKENRDTVIYGESSENTEIKNIKDMLRSFFNLRGSMYSNQEILKMVKDELEQL